MERKNAWKSCDEAKLAQVNALCADYIKFISDCKTERECVEESIRLAEAAGYKNLNDCIEAGTPLKAGDKVYANNMGKTLALFVVGTEPMEKGMHILVRTLTLLVLMLSRIRFIRMRILLFLIHTTMAESRSISGLLFRLLFTALLQRRTALLSML